MHEVLNKVVTVVGINSVLAIKRSRIHKAYYTDHVTVLEEKLEDILRERLDDSWKMARAYGGVARDWKKHLVGPKTRPAVSQSDLRGHQKGDPNAPQFRNNIEETRKAASS
jgi:hypothetical protein